MINYTQIRDDIITQLHTYLNIPVVLAEQNTPKPPYPHATYKVIANYIQQATQAIETYNAISSDNPDFDYDIEYTRTEQPMMTISISTYSLTTDEAETIALNAMAWFKFVGYDYLSDKGVVVVETSDIQDRDTLIIDTYERRRGFDVKIRVLSELAKTTATIEHVDIEKQ